MNHISVVPLIGGFPIAATEVLGQKPDMVLSYPEFWGNDELYVNYSGVPYDLIYNDYKLGDVDIVTGTPPCAGLSTAASTKDKAHSKVNDWMYNTAAYVCDKIAPKIYIFENAPGLYTEVGDYARSILHEIAIESGYSITFYKTNSLRHGIPQKRIRTYCIFSKTELAPILARYNRPYPLLKDYLKRMPKYQYDDWYAAKEPRFDKFEVIQFLKESLGYDYRDTLLDAKPNMDAYDYIVRNNLLQDFYKFAKSDETKKSLEHIIKALESGKNWRSGHNDVIFFRDYVNVIYGGSMALIAHPEEDRFMNISEFMYLMGMPTDFKITEKDFGKIGQNVPVRTSMDLINECVEVIKGNRPYALTDFSMQDNTK